ncbi:MAG: SAM-dependent methyltransferase [Acidimicrobiales bacterium]
MPDRPPAASPDCLLQRGAERVYAVDVGTHQLHERLRADIRVDVREQTDVRSLSVEQLGGPVDLVVGDLSFISLGRALPTLVGCATPGATMLLLIKAVRSRPSGGVEGQGDHHRSLGVAPSPPRGRSRRRRGRCADARSGAIHRDRDQRQHRVRRSVRRRSRAT